MAPRPEEGGRVRVVRAPHRLLTDLVGKEGEVIMESGGIFKVDILGHGPVWCSEGQLKALPEGEKVPEAEGGPQDPREVE